MAKHLMIIKMDVFNVLMCHLVQIMEEKQYAHLIQIGLKLIAWIIVVLELVNLKLFNVMMLVIHVLHMDHQFVEIIQIGLQLIVRNIVIFVDNQY